ncbi:hypothetical protein KUCAC02_000749, partial [Chaenocephalus aceratus]
VNTLAQSTSQAPTDGGKRSRGGKTCFEYPPKETKKYQGKVKSKGEYVAGEPVEVSPRVPPRWVVATWEGDYFTCPKERCPPYGKWLDNEEPPVHIRNEDGDDWHPNNDQTIGRIVLYTHSPTGGYRKCAIRYFSDPQNWDTLAGFRNGTRGLTHLPYIWKYDENWHRVLNRSAMMWQNKGDKELNTSGGIKSLQVTCFKTNSDSSYFAITDDGCGNKYMLTDPKREGCYEEVRDKCGSAWAGWDEDFISGHDGRGYTGHPGDRSVPGGR